MRSIHGLGPRVAECQWEPTHAGRYGLASADGLVNRSRKALLREPRGPRTRLTECHQHAYMGLMPGTLSAYHWFLCVAQSPRLQTQQEIVAQELERIYASGDEGVLEHHELVWHLAARLSFLPWVPPVRTPPPHPTSSARVFGAVVSHPFKGKPIDFGVPVELSTLQAPDRRGLAEPAADHVAKIVTRELAELPKTEPPYSWLSASFPAPPSPMAGPSLGLAGLVSSLVANLGIPLRRTYAFLGALAGESLDDLQIRQTHGVAWKLAGLLLGLPRGTLQGIFVGTEQNGDAEPHNLPEMAENWRADMKRLQLPISLELGENKVHLQWDCPNRPESIPIHPVATFHDLCRLEGAATDHGL